MGKREFAADVDVDGPRSKRRKDAESNEPVTEDVDMVDIGASSEHEENERDEGPTMSPEQVREEGLKVWHIVKDAVDKEGRAITPLFMRLPSKRQYPDYYEIIKNPIALDDVKIKLDEGTYASLEELRQDLEMCFKNAKKYNQRESVIWKDAKTLQKLANKEIDKIVRRDDEDVDVEGSGDEEGKKKEKGTNIHRLMKNRLQKLTSKTDQDGRRVSAAFMDLPSRKKWPIYYKLIKRPMCIEDIFKKIKRKEYMAVKDFMDDVELVFTNAMEFNEDHSEIWEDAVTMKDYFHQIMNHLPAKYGMSNASDFDPTPIPDAIPKKIMLKVSLAGSSKDKGSSAVPLQTTDTNTSSGTSNNIQQLPGLGSSTDITVPKQAHGTNGTHTKKPKVKSPSMAPAKIAIPSTIPAASGSSSTPTQVRTQAAVQAKPAYVAQQATFSATPPAQPAHSYPANRYTPQSQHATQTAKPAVAPTPSSAPTPAPTRTSATPAPAAAAAAAATSLLQMSKPAASAPPSAAGIRHVRLVTQPLGRKLDLSSDDGVKSWAMRLAGPETGLLVRNILFAMEEEEEEAEEGEEDQGGEDKADQALESPKKKRGRGRPRKTANVRKATGTVKEEPAAAPKATSVTASPKQRHTPSLEDVVVKLDGMQVRPKSKENEASEGISVDGSSEWAVAVNTGSHVLEIGKKGNSVLWKVYLERRGV